MHSNNEFVCSNNYRSRITSESGRGDLSLSPPYRIQYDVIRISPYMNVGDKQAGCFTASKNFEWLLINNYGFPFLISHIFLYKLLRGLGKSSSLQCIYLIAS